MRVQTEQKGIKLGKATFVRDSIAAILFRLDECGLRKIWVPKACIHDDSEIWKEGQEPGKLIVVEWWYLKVEAEGRLG